MDVSLDLDTFLQLVQEFGPLSALGIVLFFAIVKATPHVVTMLKEDRQARRDHEFRMAELALKYRERPQLGLENEESKEDQVHRGDFGGS